MRVAILVLGLMATACGPKVQTAENLPPAPTESPDSPTLSEPTQAKPSDPS